MKARDVNHSYVEYFRNITSPRMQDTWWRHDMETVLGKNLSTYIYELEKMFA